MRDLETAGRALVENPPAPPTPIAEIETRARRRNRRRGRATIAFATVALVLVGAVAIVVDRRQSSPPVVTKSQPPPAPHFLSNGTLQLRAHLGVGVPKGWIPVDYGDARLWVPPDWDVTAGGCARQGSAGWIELGGPYKQACRTPTLPAGAPLPFISITTLDTTTGVGPIRRVVNTYPVFNYVTHGMGESYSVPALHVVMGFSSRDTRVLQTLGPSARAVALGSGAQAVPKSWRRVEYAGVSIAAPSSWPAQLVAGQFGPGCENLEPRYVWAGPPNLDAQCQMVITKPLPTDGVWIDHFPIAANDNEPSVPLNGPWGPRVKIRLLTGRSVLSAPELLLHVTIDEYTSELDIGLGPDGRVAKAILQSITALPGGGSGFQVEPAGNG